jgi:hypothetical protein
MGLRGIHASLEAALRTAAGALQRGEVPFVLGGSMAGWARGGPPSHEDVDLYVKPGDAERALALLVDAGMRAERPPEQWLLKAWSGDVLLNLIFAPLEGPVSDESIAAADWLQIAGVWMRVAPIEDVLVGRLLALSEQDLGFRGLVDMGRGLRERVDWAQVRARTDGSPCARAYLALLEGLGVIDAPDTRRAQRARPDTSERAPGRPRREAHDHARGREGARSRPGRTRFDRFAEAASDIVSGATFFAISAALVVLWLPTIVIFRSVDTWQLVINTATSILAFLLVALLQNSERRSDRAASRKLDTLSAAVAELLDAQLSEGDPDAQARRVRELRETIRVEEEI